MPKRISNNKRKKRMTNHEDHMMTSRLDSLAEYETFMKDVPTELRQMILDGLDAVEIYDKADRLAAIRMVAIALTDKDSSRAIAAIKDIMDRKHGKATERKEVSHKFEGLSDEELDAILVSEISELDDVSVDQEKLGDKED